MTEPNGNLTHTAVHGYVWTTQCRKCGTTQRVRIGNLSPAEACAAVDKISAVPMECPNGYHTELGGWRHYWSLDLMLARLAAQAVPSEVLAA